MKELNNLSKIFKALSNPHRLELYLKIKNHHDLDIAKNRQRTCFLSKLCENLNLGAPTISHHIKELVNAGLVETEKEGKFTVCSINNESIGGLIKVFEASGKKS
jgi:ArsR family transcriptional regulator